MSTYGHMSIARKTPIPRPNGQAMGAFLELLGENRPWYSGSALHVCRLYIYIIHKHGRSHVQRKLPFSNLCVSLFSSSITTLKIAHMYIKNVIFESILSVIFQIQTYLKSPYYQFNRRSISVCVLVWQRNSLNSFIVRTKVPNCRQQLHALNESA